MTTSSSHIRSIVRNAADAERRWFYGGGVHAWKLSHAESGGAFSVFEDELTRGKCTPLHSHDDSDELVYVIDGEIILSLAGEERRVAAGGLTLVQRGTPHALLVVSETARLLVIATSAHTEAFFRAASEPGESGAVDFGRVREAAVQTGGMVFLGPPPFAKP
jgi:quercetin dioxygenase-like cupin family protein